MILKNARIAMIALPARAGASMGESRTTAYKVPSESGESEKAANATVGSAKVHAYRTVELSAAEKSKGVASGW